MLFNYQTNMGKKFLTILNEIMKIIIVLKNNQKKTIENLTQVNNCY